MTTTIEGSAAGLWKILSDSSVIKVTNLLYRLWTTGPFHNESCQSQRPRGAALCSFWLKKKKWIVFKLLQYEERLSKQFGEVTAQDEKKKVNVCAHTLWWDAFFCSSHLPQTQISQPTLQTIPRTDLFINTNHLPAWLMSCLFLFHRIWCHNECYQWHYFI